MDRVKVVGEIHISHSIQCPNCMDTMWDDIDTDWWNENITDQFPCEDAYKETYEVECKMCKTPLIIEHFEY